MLTASPYTPFALIDGGTLGSPFGGTNIDRCQRQKQGAVSGAALRFLQAPAVARRKKRLSARGPAMVTFSDLIQTGILIIGLIDLVLRLVEADRNKRQ